MATKRLKELLEARKASARDNSGMALKHIVSLRPSTTTILSRNLMRFPPHSHPLLLQISNRVLYSSCCQWKWNKWTGNELRFLSLVCTCLLLLDFETILTYLNHQSNEKSLQRWLDHELEVMVNVHEVRHEYEKQSHVYVLYLSVW